MAPSELNMNSIILDSEANVDDVSTNKNYVDMLEKGV